MHLLKFIAMTVCIAFQLALIVAAAIGLLFGVMGVSRYLIGDDVLAATAAFGFMILMIISASLAYDELSR